MVVEDDQVVAGKRQRVHHSLTAKLPMGRRPAEGALPRDSVRPHQALARRVVLAPRAVVVVVVRGKGARLSIP